MMEEMSFQVSLENCQGFIIPDGGGKFIPPARNGEWKHSGEWFCASPWWHHEASLARRSQTSGGDVDCYKWVEVGGWACGCSICKHQCLELDASYNREQAQGDKERCNMGPFGFAEDQSCCCCHKWSFLTASSAPSEGTLTRVLSVSLSNFNSQHPTHLGLIAHTPAHHYTLSI